VSYQIDVEQIKFLLQSSNTISGFSRGEFIRQFLSTVERFELIFFTKNEDKSVFEKVILLYCQIQVFANDEFSGFVYI